MSLKKLYYVLGIFYLSIVTSCSFSSPIKSSRNGKLILPKKRDLKVDSNLDAIETPGNAGHNIPAAVPPAAVEAEEVAAVAAEQPEVQEAVAKAKVIIASVNGLSSDARNIKKTSIEKLVIDVKAMIALTQKINAPSQEVLTSVQTTTRNVLMLSRAYFIANGKVAVAAQLATETQKVTSAPVTNKESLLVIVNTAMAYLTNTVIQKLPD